jgi:hypothetical protein
MGPTVRETQTPAETQPLQIRRPPHSRCPDRSRLAKWRGALASVAARVAGAGARGSRGARWAGMRMRPWGLPPRAMYRRHSSHCHPPRHGHRSRFRHPRCRGAGSTRRRRRHAPRSRRYAVLPLSHRARPSCWAARWPEHPRPSPPELPGGRRNGRRRRTFPRQQSTSHQTPTHPHHQGGREALRATSPLVDVPARPRLPRPRLRRRLRRRRRRRRPQLQRCRALRLVRRIK